MVCSLRASTAPEIVSAHHAIFCVHEMCAQAITGAIILYFVYTKNILCTIFLCFVDETELFHVPRSHKVREKLY